MGTISVNLPEDNTTADVSDINDPINTIVTAINGNLDNDNIKAGAGIDGSKLADKSVVPTKIASTYSASYTGTASAVSTSAAIVKLSTKAYDASNAYSTSSGLFTAPVAGVYRFGVGIEVNTSNGGNNTGAVYLYKNGSSARTVSRWAVGAISSSVMGSGSAELLLAAGDTIGVYASNSIATSYASAFLDISMVAAG